MKFVITIDVEEDNWGEFIPVGYSLENIKRIEVLQEMFDQYDVKPTYLINYPVATDKFSIELFKSFLAEGKCEIGMHCHPWNTPPFKEEICEHNTMLCNLPEALVYQKLSFLHETICENFGVPPVSFRAGRWGFGPSVARSLCKLGYRVDTSVSPFVNWSVYHGPDFSRFQLHPYRFDPEDIAVPKESGVLLEVPTTVGFLQGDFERRQRWMEYLETGICEKLHLKGILSRLGLLNKVWLSPELADAKSMVKLAEKMKKMNSPCLNMSFHSTSLMAGLSPFVRTKKDEILFLKVIEKFLVYIKSIELESVTLREFIGE